MTKAACFIIIFFYAPEILAQHTYFVWPVKAMPAYSEVTNFYTVNNYIDQDATTSVKDWNCGTKTYNGHSGLDIDLWPFSWNVKDNNYVAVVAAADGIVELVDDQYTNDDSSINCTSGTCVSNCSAATPNTNINRIVIRHADSSLSYYLHLKTNSHQVSERDIVKAGQVIAFPGSSGPSTHPHLHFEVHQLVSHFPDTYKLIDPYNSGNPSLTNCNLLNTDSWWLNQKPNDEPGIVRVMTHYAVPDLINDAAASNFCKAAENKKDRSNFNPGDFAYLGVALRDVSLNNVVNYVIYYPNGNILLADFAVAQSSYKKWYKTFGFPIPNNAPSGTYKVIANYAGTTGVHFFTVGCPSNVTATETVNDYSGYIASSAITSTNITSPGKRLRLQAGGVIRLKPGFKAVAGSIVKARIRDCNYSE